MSTPQYDLLRASITNADCLRAFDFLYPNHIGYPNRVDIEEIEFCLFRKHGSGENRKARDVVELLRLDFGIAVCSASGKSGRWLASSEAEKQECLADFYARRKSLDNVIHALEHAQVPPPAEARRKEQAVQVGLFG